MYKLLITLLFLFSFLNAQIKLTQDEQKWLEQNPTIRIAYLNYLPTNKENDNIHKKYIQLLSKYGNLNISLINFATWNDAYNEASKGDYVQGILNLSYTKKREENDFFYVKPYYLTPTYLVVKNNDEKIKDLKDLNNQNVLIKTNSIMEDVVKDLNFDLKYIYLDSELEMIKELIKEDSKAQAFLTFINSPKLYEENRLKIVNKYFSNNSVVYIGISKKHELLNSILKKAHDKIPYDELSKIQNEDISEDNSALILKIITLISLITIVLIYYNRKLKKQVALKNEEMKSLLKAYDKNIIASKTDKKGVIVYVSDAFCEISGYSREELLGKTHRIVRHEDTPKEVFIDLWKTIKENKTWKGELKNRRKDGTFYWVYAVITPECTPDGICGYSAIRQDITSRKEVEELSESLEEKVLLRTQELNDERRYIKSIMDTQNNIVVTASDNRLRTVNRAFLNFFKIKDKEEFFDKYGYCICDAFATDSPKQYIKKRVNNQNWAEYIYNNPNSVHKTKIWLSDEKHFFSITVNKFEFNKEKLYVAVLNDITESENIRRNIETILSNIMLPVFIVSKNTGEIIYANKNTANQYKENIENILNHNFTNLFHKINFTILKNLKKYNYIENYEGEFQTSKGNTFNGLLSLKPINYDSQDCYLGMIVDITKQKEVEAQIRKIHKKTRDSINYASLIQATLIPNEELFKECFIDYFNYWEPKDVIGGDIYFFEKLRNDDEFLLMVIDCTGHGVPGAFVTMLVKAIERQIVSRIINSNEVVSPSKILSIFNRSIKHLMKQDNDSSNSSAGFDGQILYINKKDKIIKASSARNEIFYIQDNEFKIIKGDRHSIGYKDSDVDFVFKEYELSIKSPTSFYLSSDGYWDQIGGEKGRSFGKKRFKALIEEIKDESMEKQKELLNSKLKEYQSTHPRQDDITITGFKL